MPLEFTPVTMPGYSHRIHASDADRKRAHEATRPKRERKRSVDPADKRMIAWDGEGMKLSGSSAPQHYVLFGCSAEPQNPLMISTPKGDLDFVRIVDYACDMADRHPNAFHVGYFFSYDQNMIVKSLSPQHKLRLYEKNRVQTKRGDTIYRVQWTPGKRLRLTRIRGNGKRSSLIIDDMAAFFATSFVKAYTGLFPEDVGTPEYNRVVEGKADRAEMLWEDMPRVLAYWQDEIILLQKLADKFRAIMYDAGFKLREWYGPGALANLIRRERGLVEHEWGGKEPNLPPAVHDASKRAYFGGHVEQYVTGKVRGPIYVYDINSAYPAAFAEAPSLAEGGIWKQVEKPTPGVRMGVYRLRYHGADPLPWEPQPLPHRDARGNTSYPSIVDGWYWTPEAAIACRYYGARIVDAWEWWPEDKSARPWAFFAEMYQTRLRLKRANNPMERAFKLSLNSMYGKVAQRAGWDEEKKAPPRAHTLPLAGFITAWCRARILEMLAKMDNERVIAVETDGIFSTQPPDELGIEITDKMGDWSVKVWDELVYVQNGLYLYREGDEWHNKTRGMDAKSITPTFVMDYLRSLFANTEWEPIEVPQSERFIGLGSAVSRSRTREGKGGINPFKLASLHCRWYALPRAMAPGLKGKRIHIAKFCPACKAHHSPAVKPHRLVVRSAALGDPKSFPYLLPWEMDYEKPRWLEEDERAQGEIVREQA